MLHIIRRDVVQPTDEAKEKKDKKHKKEKGDKPSKRKHEDSDAEEDQVARSCGRLQQAYLFRSRSAPRKRSRRCHPCPTAPKSARTASPSMWTTSRCG